MNPYTGEVLALVSTPSYDNNDFVRGMDNSQWSALNEMKTGLYTTAFARHGVLAQLLNL